ncbi:MAG: toll/interleukin-1 receptor domain-containing protein [Acidobacteria bacterium]|nr:toll/interleukin-1 receptor domain-containing protein [Acidobacteriota bacterium]
MSGDQSSAFGDAQDDFGTLGRNGAQHTPELSHAETTLGAPTTTYRFVAGHVYNLDAHQVVRDHRDVANASVAGLMLNVIARDPQALSGERWFRSTPGALEAVKEISPQPEGSAQRTTDPVDAAVFCPAAVAKASVFLVQVFLYPPGAETAISAAARSADENAAHRGSYSLPLDLPHGTRIDVHLDFAVLSVAEPDAMTVWRGRPASVQFEAAVPADATQSTAIGRVRFAVGGVPAGTLRFQVGLLDADAAPAPVARRRAQGVKYRQAFVSYSSADRAEVLRRVQAFKIAGISVFQDILDLDPGERWERALYREIDRCDVFFLFWSRAAAASEWVTKEIEYALSRQQGDENRPPEIQPVPIEGPPVVPPPKNLSHLHFNDALLAHIGGSPLPPTTPAAT